MNKTESFILTNEEKKVLLNTAHEAVEFFLENNTYIKINLNKYSQALNEKCGAFVSIYLDSELRGCIGRFKSGENHLVEIVSECAVSAAFFDNRFPSIVKEEVQKMIVEISVLTPLMPLESLDNFVLGKHGIYIKKGYHTGTFLPQVATKTNWTKEEFISHCSENKAGLGWNGWKTAELYTYEAIIFK